jgi:hypothetical protein
LDYNKFISNKTKCIDDCNNDDIYKYEYNNNCYEECPNDTYHRENSTICHKIESESIIIIENKTEIKTAFNNNIDQPQSTIIPSEYKTQTEFLINVDIFCF